MYDLIQLSDGTWINPITPKEAFNFRCDIPMYVVYLGGPPNSIEKDMPVEDYRFARKHMSPACSANRYTSFWWSEYQRFVEVDPPDKEEYVCSS